MYVKKMPKGIKRDVKNTSRAYMNMPTKSRKCQKRHENIKNVKNISRKGIKRQNMLKISTCGQNVKNISKIPRS